MSGGDFTQGLPKTTLVDDDKNATPPWLAFFLNLLQRTGGSNGSVSGILDQISDVVGSILYRAPDAWEGLTPAPPYEVLQMNAELPEWALLGSANFAPVGESAFLVGPATGVQTPTFRTIETADLVPIAGQFPGTTTNDAAAAGNVGQFPSVEIPSGSAVAMTTTVAIDIASVSLTPGDWDIWANVALTAAPTSINAWIGLASATDPGAPNFGAYATMGNQSQVFPVGTRRVSLSALTTLYLSANATFSGSLSGYGFLGARRRR